MMVATRQSSASMLSELLRDHLSAPLLHDLEIHGLAMDSRVVTPGDLFFALKGISEHGLMHLAQAIAQGAAAVVWEQTDDHELLEIARHCQVLCYPLDNLTERMGQIASEFHRHPSQQMHCMGVTGTDGKTSVAHFIAQALHTRQSPCGLLGTLGYGVFGELQEPTHTTPDALRLQAELAHMRDLRVKNIVMEVSSHALDQYRVSGIEFDTAILTNISREHLDYHGDMESYAASKRRLFQLPGLKSMVLNLDDVFGESLLEGAPQRQRIISYSVNAQFKPLSKHEWLCARHIERLHRGLRIEIDSSWGSAVLESRLLGTFNASNLLAAAGALLAADIPFDKVIERLSNVTTVPGRMEAFSESGQPLVIVDYAHTPNALQKVLIALRQHCSGKLICVFGAGGDRDQGKRSEMGSVAEQNADRLIITSDNPRTENPESIIDMIAAGIRQADQVRRVPDRAQAIAEAIRSAGENDVVLVAGKGHETYQQIGIECIPFSDREQVMHVLRECKA
jgi:UDP-N-acetylmuramoyl-L-alanyl-D-glutamate--2,6-diaminopimelate ligase